MKRLAVTGVILSVMILAYACSDERANNNESTVNLEQKLPTEPVSESLEGTSYEDLVKLQERFNRFFDESVKTEEEASEIIPVIRDWQEDHLKQFNEACRRSKAYFNEKPELRLLKRSNAGRQWREIKNRIREIVKKWGPGNRHEVESMIQQFECR